jgi:hypothetical protein
VGKGRKMRVEERRGDETLKGMGKSSGEVRNVDGIEKVKGI